MGTPVYSYAYHVFNNQFITCYPLWTWTTRLDRRGAATASLRKVYAGLARTPGVNEEPARVRDNQVTLMRALSGFVHGAYIHIMELYGGTPARFHTSGMRATPRQDEMIDMLSNYVYRTISCVELVAARSGAAGPYEAVKSLRTSFREEMSRRDDAI